MNVVPADTPTTLPDRERQITATLLDQLDAHAHAASARPADQRTHARHPFRVDCVVRFFGADRSVVEQAVGRTRNISRAGIGLLVKRWFRIGDPLYLILSVPDAPPSRLTGTVVFARRARGSWFEVGVRLVPRSPDNLLAPTESEDVHAAEAAGGEAPASRSLRADKLNALSLARAAAGYSKEAKQAILRMAVCADEVVRARALEALIDVGGKVATGAVIQALGHENVDIRLAAIAAVGALGISEAVPVLKARLDDPSVKVQLRAAATLGRFGQDAGLPIVERCLEQEDDHAALAALAYGAIIKQRFRPNAEGVAAARRYMNARRRIAEKESSDAAPEASPRPK